MQKRGDWDLCRNAQSEKFWVLFVRVHALLRKDPEDVVAVSICCAVSNGACRPQANPFGTDNAVSVPCNGAQLPAETGGMSSEDRKWGEGMVQEPVCRSLCSVSGQSCGTPGGQASPERRR